MPYIKQAQREPLDPVIDELTAIVADVPGKLAYTITRLTLEFVQLTAALDVDGHRSVNFEDYAKAIGVLEAVKLELYRQQVATYEDAKRLERGGVS